MRRTSKAGRALALALIVAAPALPGCSSGGELPVSAGGEKPLVIADRSGLSNPLKLVKAPRAASASARRGARRGLSNPLKLVKAPRGARVAVSAPAGH